MITFAPPIEADMLRLRHEFLAMPGMSLTAPQVARLLGIRLEHADAFLTELENEGFLLRMSDGAFRRTDPLMS
jgi:Fic family protein